MLTAVSTCCEGENTTQAVEPVQFNAERTRPGLLTVTFCKWRASSRFVFAARRACEPRTPRRLEEIGRRTMVTPSELFGLRCVC